MYGVDEEVLKNGLKEKFIKDAYWLASALYFIAGTMETKRKMEENKEDIYILDRSFWSTLAVHWDRSIEDRNIIVEILKYGKRYLPIPNIIFLLSASDKTCEERINQKENIKEKELDEVVDDFYFNKEVNFYKWLKNNSFEETKLINIETENKNINEITENCIEELKKYINLKEKSYVWWNSINSRKL